MKKTLVQTSLFSGVVLALWFFPSLWYTRTNPDQDFFWLSERTNITGWAYSLIPVAESAERVLVADKLVSGQFEDPKRRIVRVFSAKRYEEDENAIGLFVHTPDRCWTESGWKLEPISPDLVETDLHGTKLLFERRIFHFGANRELVYFCGLTGGQPLPYRLDHNLSVGMRYQIEAAREKDAAAGAALRASDSRLWTRVWESFVSRRPLFGPKQFVRISTPIQGDDIEGADALLREFLAEWLKPSDYQAELIAHSGK